MHDIYTEQHLQRKTTVINALNRALFQSYPEQDRHLLSQVWPKLGQNDLPIRISENLLVELEKQGWKYEGKY